MAHVHSHAAVSKSNERALWLSLCLTGTFMIAEVITGVLSNSLALISDAAHMFTDTAALAIALVAIRVGRRPADKKRTFGYYRFEILAAAMKNLAASRDVSTPSSNPQICNLLCAASGGELDPERFNRRRQGRYCRPMVIPPMRNTQRRWG